MVKPMSDQQPDEAWAGDLRVSARNPMTAHTEPAEMEAIRARHLKRIGKTYSIPTESTYPHIVRDELKSALVDLDSMQGDIATLLATISTLSEKVRLATIEECEEIAREHARQAEHHGNNEQRIAGVLIAREIAFLATEEWKNG